MTELLEGVIEVRTGADGRPVAIRTAQGWGRVAEVVNAWRVETDWWRAPVGRDYVRCLLEDGDCMDCYRDLETGEWHRERRYD
ncbi:MAG TPA: hypothetical protein VND88_03000 [Candidatus Acidoferrales bacterium]|nr:hypothetical protein [Candidatus Acidoferrales bacterium]